MSKIIFSDVDGILVDYRSRVPEPAVKTIQQARRGGYYVSVYTGRSRAEMQPELWGVGLDDMISGSGSYAEYNGRVVIYQLTSEEDVKAIADRLYERGLEFYLELNSGLLVSENFREVTHPAVRQYALSKDKTAAEVKHMEAKDVPHGSVYGGELYRDGLSKVSFILSSYQDYLDSVRAFPNLKARTRGGRSETVLFGDLGTKDITKAHVTDVLLGHLRADKKGTTASGDARVDIPMLEYYEIGVSMGSGNPEILIMTDMATGDVEENGLYNTFEKLRLI